YNDKTKARASISDRSVKSGQQATSKILFGVDLPSWVLDVPGLFIQDDCGTGTTASRSNDRRRPYFLVLLYWLADVRKKISDVFQYLIVAFIRFWVANTYPSS
ncbi:hypothetical protein E4U48_007696, partial [Claviceps purpurea]